MELLTFWQIYFISNVESICYNSRWKGLSDWIQFIWQNFLSFRKDSIWAFAHLTENLPHFEIPVLTVW